MTSWRPHPRLDARRAALGLVALGLVAFVATRRLHPIQGLGNPDIGGILYSADTLNRGLLPYRDTIDLKPPGTFFLVAAIFRWVARDIGVLHLAYAIWMALGAPAIALAGRALYGRDARGTFASGLAVALYLVTIGAFDMNYASWMTPAYAWSFAMLARSLADEDVTSSLLAGMFATCAYVLKSQAVVLAPLFLVALAWGRRRALPGARFRVLAWWIAGAALGALPLFAFYASKGALRELVGGLFPFETVARYSARRNESWREIFALWLVARQQLVHFPLEWALAVAALGQTFATRRERTDRPTIVPALAFFVASFGGCALGGFRFYVHYLPQCLPSLALLAAHPAGLEVFTRAVRGERGMGRALARLGTAAVALSAIVTLGRIPLGRAASYDNGGTGAVQPAAQLVHDLTRRDDRVLVWGWQAWGVYYYADRRSPSALFKMLGEVTELNDNSELAPPSPIHFRDGPLATRFMREFDAHPPAAIVRTHPFFPGVKDDPLEEFAALRLRLDRDYDAIATYGRLTVYVRRRGR